MNGTQLKVRGAGVATIYAIQDGSANYLPATELNATITVFTAELQAIAEPKSKAYLEENPELTFRYEGFVNDENASELEEEPSVSTVATVASPAGEYPITTSGGAAANYHFAYHGSSLTIGEGAQHIAIFEVDSNATYGDEPLQLEAESTSGLAVSFESSNPDVLEVNGTQLKVRGAGVATIYAFQDGSANYLPAAELNATVTVFTAQLHAIAEPKSKAYLEENPELTFRYEGFVNDENASYLDEEPSVETAATVASPAGEYPITVSGGEAANYHFVHHGSSLIIGEGAQHLDVFEVDSNAGRRNDSILYSVC